MNHTQYRSRSNRRFVFILLLLTFALASWGLNTVELGAVELVVQTPQLAWLRPYNVATTISNAKGITLDGLGNVIVSGQMNSTNLNGSPTNQADSYVAKYDSNGQLTWARNVPIASHSTGVGVAVDNLNNIYATGGSGSPVNSGYYSKYDAAGDLIWTKQIPGTSIANAVVADSQSNTYVVGLMSGNLQGVHGFNNAFLVKNDSNGNILWAQQFLDLNRTSSQYEEALNVTLDAQGNVYVSGVFQQGNNYDTFIEKFDPQGNLLLKKTFTGPDEQGLDYFNDIKVDKNGNIFVAGSTYNPEGLKQHDALIVKYDPLGNLLWTKMYDGGPGFGFNGNDKAFGLALDDFGNVFIAGHLHEDSAQLSDYQGVDAFIAGFDNDGNYLWDKIIASNRRDYAEDIAVGANGNIYVSGRSYGVLVPGISPHSISGTHFVAMYTVPEPGSLVSGFFILFVAVAMFRRSQKCHHCWLNK